MTGKDLNERPSRELVDWSDLRTFYAVATAGSMTAAAELMGVTQSATGNPGMTVNLTVDYRSPTPIKHELVFRGWCEKVEGRKIFTRGTVHAGDTLCAEATGLFVSMRPELFERLLAMRDASATRP